MPQTPEVVQDLVEHLPRLRSMARTFARNQADADDLVQGTCLRVLARLGRIQRSNGHAVQALFSRIMKNLHIDTVRHSRRLQPITDDLAAPMGVPIAVWRTISDEALARAVAGLSPVHREIWRLSQTRQLDQREIALALNVKSSTVATRAHRARLALRRTLEQDPARQSG
jgi:RNA polymerase sigma-70 factor (ECF subfamily)